jgi:DNA-binding PadR family transcriptional regulator
MPISPNILPLTEPTLLILLSLSPGPKHGYAIMKEVETLSEERVRLSTGTLYGALKRLLDEGWIVRVDDPEPNDTDRQRKAYLLTDRGRNILQADVERLRKLVSMASLRAVET